MSRHLIEENTKHQRQAALEPIVADLIERVQRLEAAQPPPKPIRIVRSRTESAEGHRLVRQDPPRENPPGFVSGPDQSWQCFHWLGRGRA